MRHPITTSLTLAAALGTVLAGCADGPATADVAGTRAAVECPDGGGDMEQARLYIEHNATDEDTGVHGATGGEPWTVLCMTAPDGGRQVVIEADGALGELALTDLVWESNEPENADLSIEELLTMFPEGTYTFAAVGEGGEGLVGEALFTHAIPSAPTITAPALADEDDVEPSVDPDTDLVVTWQPVTTTVAGDPLDVSGYELIVTDDEADDPHGWSRPELDVHLPPDATSFTVPAAFLQPGTRYEVEVLVLERSGNQTITVGFVRTT